MSEQDLSAVPIYVLAAVVARRVTIKDGVVGMEEFRPFVNGDPANGPTAYQLGMLIAVDDGVPDFTGTFQWFRPDGGADDPDLFEFRRIGHGVRFARGDLDMSGAPGGTHWLRLRAAGRELARIPVVVLVPGVHVSPLSGPY